MEFLFGIVTAWFVVGGALFIRDASNVDLKPIRDYLLWPRTVWRVWP